MLRNGTTHSTICVRVVLLYTEREVARTLCTLSTVSKKLYVQEKNPNPVRAGKGWGPFIVELSSGGRWQAIPIFPGRREIRKGGWFVVIEIEMVLPDRVDVRGPDGGQSNLLNLRILFGSGRGNNNVASSNGE
jgi:hypothetical protein